MKDLYIIGAGGFGREAAWLVERINASAPEWNLKGFIDDDQTLHGTEENGYQVLGGCDYLSGIPSDFYTVCAVGNAKVRKTIIEKVKSIAHLHFATLIDPSVLISNFVEVGEGSIICAGSILTVNISIGSHNIINLDCTIGHDVVTGAFVTFYPSVNVSGQVHIGECCEFGTGSQIIQGKSFADNIIIGAGAVVVKDIGISGTYAGIPAERI